MVKIIGIAGPAQSGKDTIARYIEEDLEVREDIQIQVRRFADPLKDMVAELFGWDYELLNEDPEFKEKPDYNWMGITPRQALQLIGTDMFRDGPLKRNFGINIWVDIMAKEIKDALSFGGNVTILIPDCRFLDEFELIHALGGKVVFADPRPRIPRQDYAHSSEQDMWKYTGFDFSIDTGANLATTEEQVKTMIRMLYYEERIAEMRFIKGYTVESTHKA